MVTDHLLKLKGSDMYNQEKVIWHQDPGHHGAREITTQEELSVHEMPLYASPLKSGQATGCQPSFSR